MRYLLSVPAMRPPGSPRTGVPGRLEYERAAGERPPRARPQRRGSPGPIPNPAVKPAFAESTAAQGCGRAGRRARGGRFSICAGRGPQGMSPCGPFRAPGPDRVGAMRLRGAKRRASPKDPRRIAWEAVEGPLRSRARSTADGRVSCPCRPATGVLSRGPFQRFGEVSASRAALRALPASFRAAGSLAGPVLLAASVGGSVWAPSRAFLRQRGSNNLTVVARLALSRRSAVSKGLRPGCPPL